MPQSEGYVTGEGTPRTVELAAGTEPRLGITVVQAAAGGLILNTPIPVTDNLGSLTVDDGGGVLTVDGAVTIQEPLSVDDNGGSLTVDGTVTANQGTANATPWTIVDTWAIELQAEENANDSDKTLTVPANTIWQVLWIWVELVSTATVGTRQVTVQILDAAADVVMTLKAGATQAASLTRNYLFAPALADLTAFRDTSFLMTPCPPTLILPAGYGVHVYDSAAVDAAADDMVVQMMCAVRAA